jgi:hypothetical protein
VRALTGVIRGGLLPKAIPSVRELLTDRAQIEGCVIRGSATCSAGRQGTDLPWPEPTGLPTTPSRGPLRRPTSG